MLSIETDARVAKLFLTLAEGERDIEFLREELGANIGFNPYQIFNTLDTEGKNYIDEFNFVEFLKANSIQCSLNEARLIILFYDTDFNGNLSYSEFLNLILSAGKRYLQRRLLGLERPRPVIPYEVEYHFIKLMSRELELVRNIDLLLSDIKSRYDFQVADFFSKIQTYPSVSESSLMAFFDKVGATYSNDDIIALMKRLDIDGDGRISYIEFKRIFSYPLMQKFNEYSYSNLKASQDVNPLTSYPGNWLKSSKTDFRRSLSPLRNTRSFNTTYSLSPNARQISTNISLRLSPERKFSPNRMTRSRFSPNKLSPKRDFITRSPPRSPLRSDDTFSSKRFDSFNYSRYNIRSGEDTFVSFLKRMMEVENDIEKSKSDLALQSDFNVEDAFRIFELDGRGFITDSDLKYGLNLLGIFPTNDEVKLLLKRFDLVNDGVLNYASFFDMVTPFDKDYRSMVEKRLPSSISPQFSRVDVFFATTKLYIQSLFKLLINTESQIEGLRQGMSRMKRFDLNEIFFRMDLVQNGSLTDYDLASYLKRKGIVFLPRESDLLFIRFDRNRDGKVDFNEISNEVIPHSLEYFS